MRKIIACLFLFAPGALAAAAPDYTQLGSPQTARPGMTTNRVGAAGRPTVPVTTTTTVNTYVPETDLTDTSKETWELDINGRKAACLMNSGNVWASRLNSNPFGVPVGGSALREDANPNNNVCFSVVAVSSKDIPNMGRFFPPRYFQQGSAIECGSWLDEASLDAAILDAKKNPRIAGTIAAAVVGAGVGFGLTEIIGQNIKGGKTAFMGQKGLEGNEQLVALLKTLKKDNEAQWKTYTKTLTELAEMCLEFKKAGQEPEDCKCEGITCIELAELVSQV